MQNSINLHTSQRFYEVTHQGKQYKCARVSDIIEQTSPTPIYLKQWMVNCAVETLSDRNLTGLDMRLLKKQAWSAHQIKSQQALDVGTKVHGWINRGMMDESKCDEESLACWKAYCSFAAEYLPISIGQEMALYDLKDLFAGTCDWIGILGAKKAHSTQNSTNSKPRHYIYIIDWKTSKAIHNNYKIQVTVYKHMIKSLIKSYLKNTSQFSPSTAKIINDIILAAGKNPKIVCGIVRLPKKPSARKHFEFVKVTAKEEKVYLKEFALMAKLHNLRTKEKNDGKTDGK